jgi:hypothetical protein
MYRIISDQTETTAKYPKPALKAAEEMSHQGHQRIRIVSDEGESYSLEEWRVIVGGVDARSV